ncbi:MAG: NAD(P)H-quinone oxidoreductase [Spongiibacteraceae bacterium]
MKYIELNGYGAADVMTLCEMDKPSAQADEVVIRVKAAGINRPDIAQRKGLYPPPPDASPILGLEVAGIIESVGETVDDSWLNREVCALVNGGGYAEFVAVPITQCLPIPKGLTLVEAAAIPESFFTVWSNVFERAALKSGEKFLVHGGSSGIGSTAIQLAKALGAEVYTTAGSEEKCEYCRQLGADLAINYREEDFVERIESVTNGKGVDVILDMVGGSYIQKNIQVAALDARIVVIAFLEGARANVNFAPLMMKRINYSGSTLRPRSKEYKAQLTNELIAKVWPLIETDKIRPSISATFAFSDVVKAHELMESNKHMGKIVLIMDE